MVKVKQSTLWGICALGSILNIFFAVYNHSIDGCLGWTVALLASSRLWAIPEKAFKE